MIIDIHNHADYVQHSVDMVLKNMDECGIDITVLTSVEMPVNDYNPKHPVTPGGKIEALLEKYPNLYCDISMASGYNALTRDLDFTRKFLLTWQDRTVYGRDTYGGSYNNLHRELLEREALSLPVDVLEKIYCDNARRILRNGDKIN